MPLLVEDRELLRAFRRGEPNALRQVFLHYSPEVARLLRRGFGFRSGQTHVRFAGYSDSFGLEDALQNTFRRAFGEAARNRYDGLRPYRAYLHTIARNVVISDFQAKSRSLELFGIEPVGDAVPLDDEFSAADDPLGEEALEPRGLPEQDLVGAELRALVRQFRAGLDGREAEVFQLRFDEGLSHSDIAVRTGLSASKIKTAEARIRRELVRHLHRHGYLEGRRMRQAGPRSAGRGVEGEKA